MGLETSGLGICDIHPAQQVWWNKKRKKWLLLWYEYWRDSSALMGIGWWLWLQDHPSCWIYCDCRTTLDVGSTVIAGTTPAVGSTVWCPRRKGYSLSSHTVYVQLPKHSTLFIHQVEKTWIFRVSLHLPSVAYSLTTQSLVLIPGLVVGTSVNTGWTMGTQRK